MECYLGVIGFDGVDLIVESWVQVIEALVFCYGFGGRA